jgi:hypothetical protein
MLSVDYVLKSFVMENVFADCNADMLSITPASNTIRTQCVETQTRAVAPIAMEWQR